MALQCPAGTSVTPGRDTVPPSLAAVSLKPSSLNLNEENLGDECFI